MRTLAVKLGDLDPHEDAHRWFIWMHAVEEFLWPAASNDKDQTRINLHPMFYSWCSEWGERLGLIDGVLSHIYPECVPLDLFYGKESVRHSKIGKSGGLAIAADLDRLWENAWITLLRPSEGEGHLSPNPRNSSRGLKFFMLTLVLRFGVFDGSPPENGRHRLVRWGDAVDSASLHLALSLYWRSGNESFNPPHLPWADVKRVAAGKLSPSTENPSDLKWHAECEGIDGYRKRLRATMEEAAFRKVAALAAEFESKGASGLEKWRNGLQLSRWFDVGRS